MTKVIRFAILAAALAAPTLPALHAVANAPMFAFGQRAAHIAATDRGVIMMRNLIRLGIQAVQGGSGPGHNGRNRPPNGNTIATFSHDRVVLGIPAAATSDEDKRLLREIARNVVSDAVRNGGVTA